MLQDGRHPSDISNIVGIPEGQIWSIGYGRIWRSVSKDYRFPNFVNKDHTWSSTGDEVIRKICNLLKSTDISFRDIAKECNVKIGVVRLVNRGRRHKKIVEEYGSIPLRVCK